MFKQNSISMVRDQYCQIIKVKYGTSNWIKIDESDESGQDSWANKKKVPQQDLGSQEDGNWKTKGSEASQPIRSHRHKSPPSVFVYSSRNCSKLRFSWSGKDVYLSGPFFQQSISGCGLKLSLQVVQLLTTTNFLLSASSWKFNLKWVFIILLHSLANLTATTVTWRIRDQLFVWHALMWIMLHTTILWRTHRPRPQIVLDTITQMDAEDPYLAIKV